MLDFPSENMRRALKANLIIVMKTDELLVKIL